MALTWTTFTPPAIQTGIANPQSFAAVNIGTASSDRIVVVAVSPNNNGPVTAVTIAGNNATLAVQSGAADTQDASIWYLNVPTGTTATINVTTTTGFPSLIGIVVGILTGSQATPAAPTAARADGFLADPQTTTSALTINTGGIGIVTLCAQTPNATPTWNVGTQDQQVSSGTSLQILLGEINSTGSQTPSITGYPFAKVGIAAVSWDALTSSQNLFAQACL